MADSLVQDMPIYRLWVASRNLERRAESELHAFGLTFQSALILVLIGDATLCRPKDIAHKASLSAAAVSRTLRVLEEKKLVLTQTRRTNRRESRVTLTEAGEALSKHARRVMAEKAELVKGRLSEEEFDAVFAALAKIALADQQDAA